MAFAASDTSDHRMCYMTHAACMCMSNASVAAVMQSKCWHRSSWKPYMDGKPSSQDSNTWHLRLGGMENEAQLFMT
jgi:hypothetical protein